MSQTGPERDLGVAADLAAVASHVRIWETRASDGPIADVGDRVSVHYQLALSEELADSNQWIEDSWSIEHPLEFQLGGGDVLAGIDYGVRGMRTASYRLLAIEPQAAFGHRGSPPRVGADATLWCAIYLKAILS